MAGIDLDTQKAGTLPGAGRIDIGYYDISSGSWTVEVPTRLITCYFGVGIADTDADNGNHTLIFTTDCSVSAGAITFRRMSSFSEEDVRFRYMVAGW